MTCSLRIDWLLNPTNPAILKENLLGLNLGGDDQGLLNSTVYNRLLLRAGESHEPGSGNGSGDLYQVPVVDVDRL